jgi:hypothetical protein
LCSSAAASIALRLWEEMEEHSRPHNNVPDRTTERETGIWKLSVDFGALIAE